MPLDSDEIFGEKITIDLKYDPSKIPSKTPMGSVSLMGRVRTLETALDLSKEAFEELKRRHDALYDTITRRETLLSKQEEELANLKEKYQGEQRKFNMAFSEASALSHKVTVLEDGIQEIVYQLVTLTDRLRCKTATGTNLVFHLDDIYSIIESVCPEKLTLFPELIAMLDELHRSPPTITYEDPKPTWSEPE